VSDLNVILGILFVLCGVLVGALCVPLALGRVPMNRYYGIRVLRSYRSDADWYAINRYGGRQMLSYAVLVAAVGVGVLFMPLRAGTLWFGAIALAPLLLLVPPLVSIFRFARHLPEPPSK
jgi:hypothetical protein